MGSYYFIFTVIEQFGPPGPNNLTQLITILQNALNIRSRALESVFMENVVVTIVSTNSMIIPICLTNDGITDVIIGKSWLF